MTEQRKGPGVASSVHLIRMQHRKPLLVLIKHEFTGTLQRRAGLGLFKLHSPRQGSNISNFPARAQNVLENLKIK